MVSASRYDSRNLRRWFLALHGTEYRPCPRPVPCQASDGTYENNRPAVPQSRQWRNEWKLAAVVPCSEHPLYRMQVDIMQRCIDTWEGCTLYGVLRNLCVICKLSLRKMTAAMTSCSSGATKVLPFAHPHSGSGSAAGCGISAPASSSKSESSAAVGRGIKE